MRREAGDPRLDGTVSINADVGNVLVTRSGGWAGLMIRLGAAFRDKPNLGNHVAIYHHTDHTDDGDVPWGIEGKPGGVGWVDLRGYLASKWTVANDAQPMTDAQRATIAGTCEAALGTPYDWRAIAADAFDALRIPQLFADNWHGRGAPGHVVCSSLAAWVYDEVGLAHPTPDAERYCKPADWSAFIITEGWL
jgi:hypothetical protein